VRHAVIRTPDKETYQTFKDKINHKQAWDYLPEKGTLWHKLKVVENFLIKKALEEVKGIKTKAARNLGITRNCLSQKLYRMNKT